MNPDIVLYAIGAACTLAYGVYTTRAKVRADHRAEAAQAAVVAQGNELEEKRVDGEAYDRAQRINEQTVEGLREDVDRLRRDFTSERALREAAEARVTKLERRVNVLSAALAQHNIPVPADS